MDDAFLVCDLERFGNLSRHRERFRDRESRRGFADPLRQRDAVDALEHEKAEAVGLFDAVNCADVRVIQLRQHPRLALEARQAIAIDGQRARQDLDRDLASELGVVRQIDFTHAACAE